MQLWRYKKNRKENEKDYEPAQKRGRNNNISSYDIQILRFQGKKHIDIWCDGRLYPVDPISKSVPPFSNCSSLLRFLGDGVDGILDYTCNIPSERDILRLKNHF